MFSLFLIKQLFLGNGVQIRFSIPRSEEREEARVSIERKGKEKFQSQRWEIRQQCAKISQLHTGQESFRRVWFPSQISITVWRVSSLPQRLQCVRKVSFTVHLAKATFHFRLSSFQPFLSDATHQTCFAMNIYYSYFTFQYKNNI